MRAALLGGALALASLLVPAAARAQLPLPIALPTSTPASSYDFPVTRIGNFDTAEITFEGQPLFRIGAPATAADSLVPPIVQRAETIEDNLQRIVPIDVGFGSISIGASPFNAATFRIEIGHENGFPTLYATDGRHHDAAPIMTLTAADATLNGISSTQLAAQWQSILQTALAPALSEIQPRYIQAELLRLGVLVAVAALLTWLIVLLRRALQRRAEVIHAEAGASDTDASDDVPRGRARVVRALVDAGPWLLNWLIFAIWVFVLLWVVSIVPGAHTYASELSSRLSKVIVLWLTIVVLDRALSVGILWVSHDWAANPFAPATERARLSKRRPTVARALENLKSILLFAIAAVWTTSILQISTVSALTIGAVVAFAVSFAAQSVIKDYVNGFLILAEDQFAIGDYVTIVNTTSGLNTIGVVEHLTLRITQIRTDDGKLVTLPNGTVAAVENATRTWSRIDFRVSVATDTDIDHALATLKAALDGLAADPQWKDKILEAPEVLGVDSVSHDGIVLRAWIKIAPANRGAMKREINRRVQDAFRTQSVSIAIPQTRLIPANVAASVPPATSVLPATSTPAAANEPPGDQA